MKSEKSSTELRVGIFVIIGLLLFCISLFLLGGDSTLVTRYYHLNTKLKEVQGLREGSIVSLSGMKVGNIVEIKFSEKNQLSVKLAINVDYKERIRHGSRTSVRTQGALGDKFIFIDPGPTDQPVHQAEEFIEARADGDLLSTITERGGEIDKVFEILKEMHILMGRINGQDRSDKVMSNMVASSQSLKEMLVQTKGLVLDIRTNLPKNQELRRSVESLSSILKKVDEGDGSLGALINDPTIHNRLKALLGGSPRNRHLKSLIRETIQKSD